MHNLDIGSPQLAIMQCFFLMICSSSLTYTECILNFGENSGLPSVYVTRRTAHGVFRQQNSGRWCPVHSFNLLNSSSHFSRSKFVSSFLQINSKSKKNCMYINTATRIPLCILRKGIARSQSQFPNSCVCERFIYSQDRSTYYPAAE